MRRQTLFLLLIIFLLPAALCTEDPSPEDIYFQDWTFQVDDQEGKLENLKILGMRPDTDYKDFIILLTVTVKDEENRPKSYVVVRYKDYSQRLDDVTAVKGFEVDNDNGIAYIAADFETNTVLLYQFSYLTQKIDLIKYHGTSLSMVIYRFEVTEKGPMLLFGKSDNFKNLCLFGLTEDTSKWIAPVRFNKGFVYLKDSKALVSRNIIDNAHQFIGFQIINFEIGNSFMMKIGNPFDEKSSTLSMDGFYLKSNADYVHLFLRSTTRIMYYKIISELFAFSIDSCIRFEMDYKMQDKDFELIGKDDDICDCCHF